MTRKLISFTHMTLDGYVNGPQGELGWANVEPEIAADVDARLGRVGAAVYGRVVYGMMAGYWPTVKDDPDSTDHDRAHMAWVEAIPKVVISRSLERAEWNNTTLIRGDVAGHVAALKAQPGGDLMVFGSPRLVHVLAALDLIDEYLIYVNPVTLGGGTPLFEPGRPAATLTRLETKAFDAGVTVLRYATR
ncbi:dihydrofolate reductase [Deinococcus metalli]|uniref:Dihydrofolate reductase n=1 Tax=Deinococcus metalli TaxID=1141878 RepID=A0A7W8NRK6_9DEIO|nr:dihydrofolate reductase family protein [Deinococcus metalli]MBB5376998.1 dihydrofolate reductase [Deinococcus metalli]GHF46932.1 riboflavin biosynthesis protein RibD [Deinococcus metalli]